MKNAKSQAKNVENNKEIAKIINKTEGGANEILKKKRERF